MFRLSPRTLAAMAVVTASLLQPLPSRAAAASPLPAPATDIPAASAKGPQTAVFAGGCFWGVEAVFRHVKGVTKAVSGYAGGGPKTADYGTQYRSAIFVTSDEQKRVAQAYIDQLGQGKAFAEPIVTQVVALPAFYPAEAYHQNYLALHPTQPYIVMHDLPKLAQLKTQFPERYVAK
jgi:peptide-methionine (S)-S-oxide reductase